MKTTRRTLKQKAWFKILEDAAVGLYDAESFSESIAHLGGGTLLAILTYALFLFVVLIPFVGFGELQRVLGKGTLKQLLFHPRSLQNQSARAA